MVNNNITEKQRSVVVFIRDYIELHDRSPTMEEIGLRFGITAPTAWQHVNSLTKKGVLSVSEHKARSIAIRAKEYRPDRTIQGKVRRMALIDPEFAQFVVELSDELRVGILQDPPGDSSDRDGGG